MAEKIAVHNDERGFLFEVLRCDNANFSKFGQVYVVGNNRQGIVRAWHRHFLMDEWFCCLAGEVLFVLYDPAAQRFEEHFLTAAQPSLVFAPRLIFHGHQALTAQTRLLAICTEPYRQDRPDEERVAFDHFSDYQWRTF